MPRPRVILHNAVSLDGRTEGFPADLGAYYGLAAAFNEDATLVGSETVLKAPMETADGEAIPAEKPDDLPLLVVPDSRGRIRGWKIWRRMPFWRDILVLCASCTPPDYLAYLRKEGIEALVLGEDRVDLRRALEALYDRGISTVRVDSGGVLNGVLLRAGLADEISLLVHPALAGGDSAKSLFHAPDPAGPEDAVGLRLSHCERLAGDLVWLRYEVRQAV
ncbi:MAG: dihydrofolate reductase family protein [Bacteroidota bacterium]